MSRPMRSPDEIMAHLNAYPDEFARIIDNVNDREELMHPASDGGWGVVEILPHLRDWEEIYFQRLSSIVEENGPYLPGFDDSLWSIERDYRGQDPRTTFAEFCALRQRTVDLLTSLPVKAWSRTGEHGYYGEISLQWLADHIVEHDQEHLQQARDALAA